MRQKLFIILGLLLYSGTVKTAHQNPVRQKQAAGYLWGCCVLEAIACVAAPKLAVASAAACTCCCCLSCAAYDFYGNNLNNVVVAQPLPQRVLPRHKGLQRGVFPR